MKDIQSLSIATIRSLCIGNDIDYVIDKLKDIKCGYRNTSCPDQIAKALEQYKKETA